MNETKNPMTEEMNNIKKSRDPKGLGFFLLKILFIAVLAGFLFVVYKGAEDEDVDLAEIDAALKADTEFTAVLKDQSDRDLMQFIGLNAADYEQVLYYRNTQALAVDEVLVVKAKEGTSVDGVETAVRKRIESQITAYSGYAPEQVKMLKNAAVKKVGNYVIYCTADKADKYKEVVLDAIQ